MPEKSGAPARATRANAEPEFNASNRTLLKVLDRYDRGG